MKFEQVRLFTFINWFSKNILPIDLAKNGFYYTGQSDRVKCFVCNLEVFNWEVGDNPFEEHKRLSDGCCDFINKKDCGNITMNEIPITKEKGEDVCGSGDMISPTQELNFLLMKLLNTRMMENLEETKYGVEIIKMLIDTVEDIYITKDIMKKSVHIL